METGSYSKGIQSEAALEAGEEIVQGEGTGERGVASLCLEWTFGQQPVNGLNSFSLANWALQKQTQAPHSVQGYLIEHDWEFSYSTDLFLYFK